MPGYTEIANYTLKEDIGEGNFGKVKLAIYEETGEKFAIKILNKKQIKIKMKNTIFKENEIITKFNHINVIFVFAIIEDENNFYIVMEYCKKGELFDYIVAHQYLSEEQSSIFFYQLINGVEHIHSRGIAHRDLKPENLLLTENNILKIIDFGLSHEFDEINYLSTKCGSPSYAAPEIIKGEKYDGFKTDIWCCGIILYAMVCGYLPFDGEDNDVLFKNIVECNPEIPDYLSYDCQELIMDILKEDPNERITIEGIKKSKFYLKGKKLCNIDYNQIERSVLKRRHRIRSFDRGEEIKDNMIKIVNTEEKRKNIHNLIEKNFKELENNKSERTTKIRNSEQKRHIKFINTKTVLNTFRDKINLININFNKKIRKFHKNMNLILNTDANAIVNNKINNDPLFNNQIITLTKYNNVINNINTVNSTINYIKTNSNSKKKNSKNLSVPKKDNKISWKIVKDNKNSEKNNQRRKYEMIYSNLSHSNDKNIKNDIELNKNSNLKSINSNNVTNSINIINNINNTINNYGTLNIFSNKIQAQNYKIPAEVIRKTEIRNIKKINTNYLNKNSKSLNLKYIKKNIHSINSCKSAKKEMKSHSKSYKENKKKSKSRTININKEKRKKDNINTNTEKGKTNDKNIVQFPSLKVENKIKLQQNFINRLINNIDLINRNKKCISITGKNKERKNIFDKINNMHSKSSKKSSRSERKVKSKGKDKFRNIPKIIYHSPINIEKILNNNKIINSDSISHNKINNNSKSKNSIRINSTSKLSKNGKNKREKKFFINNQKTMTTRAGNKINNKKRYSESKTNKIISYSRLIDEINNIRNNSKSINNIKSDYQKRITNQNKNKSTKKLKKSDLHRINIRIIKNLNNYNYQNVKDFILSNMKK